jgi:hypothetical protein
MKLPYPMWSPTALVTEEGTKEFPLPEGSKFKVGLYYYKTRKGNYTIIVK